MSVRLRFGDGGAGIPPEMADPDIISHGHGMIDIDGSGIQRCTWPGCTHTYRLWCAGASEAVGG